MHRRARTCATNSEHAAVLDTMDPVELSLVRIIKVLEKLERDHGDAA
jgi:hypothetical protein